MNETNNQESNMYPQNREHRGMSVGVALVLGISGVIIAVIIVGGIVALKGMNMVQGVDIAIQESASYLGEVQDTAPSSETQPAWENVSLGTALSLATDAGLYLVPEFGMSFVEEIDLTGDGILEGIYAGSSGNDTISFILQDDGDKVEVLYQKNRDGVVMPVELRSVGLAKVSVGYTLLPEQQGFYTFIKRVYNETDPFIWSCESFDAYRWNTATWMFEWNQALVNQYRPSICN